MASHEGEMLMIFLQDIDFQGGTDATANPINAGCVMHQDKMLL
jgi:hypothetical protein